MDLGYVTSVSPFGVWTHGQPKDRLQNSGFSLISFNVDWCSHPRFHTATRKPRDSCKQLWIWLLTLVPAGQHFSSGFKDTHVPVFSLILCRFPYWSLEKAHKEKVTQSRLLFDSRHHEMPYSKPDVQVIVWVSGYPNQCHHSSFWIRKAANHR